MAKQIRAALWHNMVTHYSIPLFQWVKANTDIDLHVLYGEERPHFRSWKVDFGEGYNYKVLPHYRIPRVEYVLNPTLPSVLTKGGYDVVMATDANEFGTQMAYTTCRSNNIPFALWTKEVDYIDADPHTGIRDAAMFLPRKFKQLLMYPSWRLSNRIKSRSDAYLVFSEKARQHVITKGAPEERIVKINNTTDIPALSSRIEQLKNRGIRQARRKEFGWEGKKVILSLSYVRQPKGIHILIEAFAKFQRDDLILAIVGDGPFKKNLQNMVQRRGLKNIEFHPHTKTPTEYFLAADISVLVPVGHEGCPLTLLESFLCECPMILSENVGSNDIIPDRRFVLPPGDADALAQALGLLLNDETLRTRFIQLGKEVVFNDCSVEQAGEGLATALRMAAQF